MNSGFERVLDRLDQDLRDHKQEMRDTAAAYARDAAEREARFHQESKEREERILAAIRENKEDTKETLTDMKQSLQNIEERMRGTEEHVRSMVAQNRWGRIATFVAILALCLTVGVTIWAAVWSVHQNQPSPARVTQTAPTTK